jgi:hypothetical protein
MPIIPAGFTVRMLQRPTAANQLDNQDDHGDHEQQMNVSAENVEADETKQPENQQNNKDSPKHKNLSFEVVTSCSFRRWQPRLPKLARTLFATANQSGDGSIFYWPAFFKAARRSQPLSSSCARAEL